MNRLIAFLMFCSILLAPLVALAQQGRTPWQLLQDIAAHVGLVVHVQGKHVQVLHNADQVRVHQVHVLQQEHQVHVQVVHLHIAQVHPELEQALHQQAVNHLVKVQHVINAVAQQVHSENKLVNLVKRTRVRKRCVKSSTVWRPQVLVAQ